MLNLTPHAITIRNTQTGEDFTFPSSGTIARVSTEDSQISTCPITGVPVMRRTTGAVYGLPNDNTPCLVSAMVLSALPSTYSNVFAPDTGATAIRNDQGQVVAVTRLISNA